MLSVTEAGVTEAEIVTCAVCFKEDTTEGQGDTTGVSGRYRRYTHESRKRNHLAQSGVPIVFDPFVAAREHGDGSALTAWERMTDTADSSLLVSVPPNPFLKYSEGPFGPDGPPQDVLDRSIDVAVTAYREAFDRALASVSDAPAINQYRYTPPSAYGRDGAISAPWEIVEFLQHALLSRDMAAGLMQSLIASAAWDAHHSLTAIFRRHKVPAHARSYGTLGSIIVRSVCEDHARHAFPNLDLGLGSIHPASAPSADYPATGDLFTVVVPYPQGSMVYVVNGQLYLYSLVRTHPDGSESLDRDSWYSHFPEEERPPYRLVCSD